MAKSKKPLDPDYLFNILKVNKYFALSSVLLLVGIMLMIKQDYDREWKSWQRKFRTLELKKTEQAVSTEKEALAQNPEFEAAKAALEEANKQVQKNEIEMFGRQKVLDKVAGEKFALLTTYQEKKSILDALRYHLEEAILHKARNVAKLRREFKKVESDVSNAKAKLNASEGKLLELQIQLSDLSAVKVKAKGEITKLETQLTRLERKNQSLARSFVNDVLRDAPMLDFIDPSLKVKEIVVPELRLDFNFTKIPRADSCTTCHVAIDLPGYEEEANPLKTHPRLDLFLASKSPHAIGEFGCTVCHQGNGGGITFSNAAHAPQNEKQSKEWEEKYHWHRSKHWTEPMLPLQYTEATCLGCHAKEVFVKGGEKITAGIQLVERSGCYSCHKIEGWENIRKPGPSLKSITSKVTESWMLKWIQNPRLFRPTTNMPQIFDSATTGDNSGKQRSNAEIRAIVTYLSAKATPYEPAKVSYVGGNVDHGKELFGKVGCLGCHAMEDFPVQAEPTQPKRPFAPELNQVGSKLTAEWMAAWLKNPKDYWHETRMPSLRLTEREIADLVAYLGTKKNPTFEQAPVPPASLSSATAIVRDYLRSQMSDVEAEKKIAAMSPEERWLYVGEKSLGRYGCFSCHEIAGFEDAKPIGTELTLEASKPVTRFDFGFIKLPPTVQDWVRQKVLHPKSFDHGKLKDPLDRLRMPNFNFTEAEADAVVTFVMGLRKYEIAPARKPAQTPHRLAVNAGRRLVVDQNCQGCHTLEGLGGDVLAHFEDKSMGPPNLIGEGKKVQQEWLFEFLGNPSTIRPWLQIRMPSFGFDDKHKNLLISYFRGIDGLDPQIETAPQVALTAEQKKFGSETFAMLKCDSCHKSGPFGADTDFSNLAPSFTLTRDRLRYEWINEWLRDPQKLLPGTRMPNFFYYEGQPMYPDADARIEATRNKIFFMQK